MRPSLRDSSCARRTAGGGCPHIIQGEITLLIGKASEEEARVGTDAFVRPSVRQRVEIMAEEKLDEKTALKKV
jgi:hypothetical protein